MVNQFPDPQAENEVQVQESTPSKRGRGRPAGSLNKSNGTQELKAEVAELRSTVKSLKDVVERMQENAAVAPIPAPPISTTTALQGNEAQRLTVVQAWVEMFHHFLNTWRITNSVDCSAEAALEEVMRKLPENPSVEDYQSLEETVTRERYYSIQHGGDAS